MINVFITMSSTALPKDKDEEYIFFFDPDITQEEVLEEMDACIKGYVFDHFSEYCDSIRVYGTSITVDTVKQFEDSINVCWSYLTAEMLENVLRSSPELKDNVIDEVITFSMDDNNLNYIDEFDFILDDDEYEEEE